MSVINTPQGNLTYALMALVHLIGEVKGAYGFDTNRLFCKVSVN